MKSWLLRKSETDSTNRKIFRAAVVVGLLSVVAKFGAIFKELFVARSFGRNDALDAFLIALVLPAALIGLVAGSFSGAFVPAYIRVLEEQGEEAARRLSSSVQIVNLMLLGGCGLLLAAGVSYYLPLLASGFDGTKLALTRSLLYLLLPYIIFGGVANVSSCVLNAHERFAVPAVLPAVTPLVCLLALLFWGRSLGIYALAGGTVLGALLELALLGRALSTIGLGARLRWYGFTPELRTVIGQYLPAFTSTLVLSASQLIDQSMAAMLSPGSVSALSYGNKIVNSVVGLTTVGLSTALLPYFSRNAARKDWRGYRRTLKVYSFLVLSVTIPLAMALVLASRPLVRLLFQRGAFTASDTLVVSATQACFAFMIPFAAWTTLYVRVLFSLQKSSLLAYAALLSAVSNVVFNIVFMRIWGVAGIALSTTVVCAIACIFVRFHALRLLKREEQRVPPPGHGMTGEYATTVEPKTGEAAVELTTLRGGRKD